MMLKNPAPYSFDTVLSSGTGGGSSQRKGLSRLYHRFLVLGFSTVCSSRSEGCFPSPDADLALADSAEGNLSSTTAGSSAMTKLDYRNNPGSKWGWMIAGKGKEKNQPGLRLSYYSKADLTNVRRKKKWTFEYGGERVTVTISGVPTG